jgi:hypothetical protein
LVVDVHLVLARLVQARGAVGTQVHHLVSLVQQALHQPGLQELTHHLAGGVVQLALVCFAKDFRAFLDFLTSVVVHVMDDGVGGKRAALLRLAQLQRQDLVDFLLVRFAHVLDERLILVQQPFAAGFALAKLRERISGSLSSVRAHVFVVYLLYCNRKTPF